MTANRLTYTGPQTFHRLQVGHRYFIALDGYECNVTILAIRKPGGVREYVDCRIDVAIHSKSGNSKRVPATLANKLVNYPAGKFQKSATRLAVK